MSFSKRGLLLRLGAAGLIVPTSGMTQSLLPETPGMDLGPFYPIEKPLDSDSDLTRIKGHKGRAKGEIIEVSGRVTTVDGTPQGGTKLEIWQANANGRYAHPNDKAPAALDADFQGYARLKTDAEGHFRFLTIKPPPYNAGDFMRAAHIHFDVESQRQRLITQLYFPSELSLLKQDQVLMHDMSWYDNPFPAYIFGALMPEKSKLEPNAAHYSFNVVLS